MSQSYHTLPVCLSPGQITVLRELATQAQLSVTEFVRRALQRHVTHDAKRPWPWPSDVDADTSRMLTVLHGYEAIRGQWQERTPVVRDKLSPRRLTKLRSRDAQRARRSRRKRRQISDAAIALATQHGLGSGDALEELGSSSNDVVPAEVSA